MITTVLTYFAKIGVPAVLIGYGAKVKYQEKYLEKVVEYVDKIKELDTELKLWEHRYNSVMQENDELVEENRKLRNQLEIGVK